MKELLIWLKQNHWCVYKDGTWYTILERDYIMGKPRKYYTEEQVIALYEKSKI